MSYLDTKYGQIFYKEYGSGEPILFLSGITMSTNSWSPFISNVTKNYKMIVIDLIGQGRTKEIEDNYTIEYQADVLNHVLERLNISKCHIVGMSYGGKVALNFSVKYIEKVLSLSLVNTDAYTTKYSQELAKAWVMAAETLNGKLFSSVLLPFMYSPGYFENNMIKMKDKEEYFIESLNQEWYERFKSTITSSRNYNIINEIHNIKVPTLVITSDEDITIPKSIQEILYKKIEGSKWVIIKESGHAIMYEKPNQFINEVLNFISTIK